MNYMMALTVGLLVVIMIALLALLAHVMDLLEAVDDLRESVDDHSCALEKPWNDGDLKYLRGNNIEHGEVKGEWI